MKFKFRGDGDARFTVAFGHTFPEGQFVDQADLPSLTALQAKKLSGNPAFETEGDLVAVVETGPKPEVDIPADWDAKPFLTQAAIARAIDPTLAKTAGGDAVKALISDEVGRRTQAARIAAGDEDPDEPEPAPAP